MPSPRTKGGVWGAFLAVLFTAAFILILPNLIEFLTQRPEEFQKISFSRETFPLTVKDSLGEATHMDHAPRRIISLTPSLTEIICAIGASDRLIAVTSFCIKSNPQYRDELSEKTIIANGINPSAEEIASLNPDLIVSVSNSSMEFVENMRKLGFPVIVFGNESLEGVIGFISVMGILTGEKSNAQKLKKSLLDRLEKIDHYLTSIPLTQRPRALIMFDLAGGGAGGKGSFMGDILERAGGRNLASQTGSRWPILSSEWIMLQDPDVIILDDYRGGDELDQAMLIFKDQISEHPLFGKLTAVRRDRIHILGDNLIVIPGPRAVDAVEKTHLILYPDLSKVESK